MLNIYLQGRRYKSWAIRNCAPFGEAALVMGRRTFLGCYGPLVIDQTYAVALRILE